VTDDLLRLLADLSGGALEPSQLDGELAPGALVRQLAALWELDVAGAEPASVFSAAWPAEPDGAHTTRPG
jgi:hypothetical protein